MRIARQNPGSTLAAFVALTLGIGATTAIFSVINSVVLRPLPVQDADRVVRMALGAGRSDILRMIVWQGVSPALIGSIIGAFFALGISRLISQLLYGVEPIDSQTYFLVILLLLVVSVSAAYLPARRAASVHPSQALRYQ
jgi:predicted lysophospholipase L1 biosynthesis ABC-type transport system permease subunit